MHGDRLSTLKILAALSTSVVFLLACAGCVTRGEDTYFTPSAEGLTTRSEYRYRGIPYARTVRTWHSGPDSELIVTREPLTLNVYSENWGLLPHWTGLGIGSPDWEHFTRIPLFPEILFTPVTGEFFDTDPLVVVLQIVVAAPEGAEETTIAGVLPEAIRVQPEGYEELAPVDGWLARAGEDWRRLWPEDGFPGERLFCEPAQSGQRALALRLSFNPPEDAEFTRFSLRVDGLTLNGEPVEPMIVHFEKVEGILNSYAVPQTPR